MKKMKMNTKNKVLASLEIAIVLCSMLVMALPAISAEQNTQEVSACTITTASEDDYVLGVYGNANEDDTIDMRDLTYVKLIFFGKKPVTKLADAKYDGKINPLDFIQIKLIIVGKEKELTLIDGNEQVKTFKLPIKTIVAHDDNHGEPLRMLGAEDKVVGVGSSLATHNVILPEMSKLPITGTWRTPDYEKILELKPDIFMIYLKPHSMEAEEKLEPHGVHVLRLVFNIPSTMSDSIKKLGYLLGKVDEAEEFINFHEGCLDEIKERTEGLSEAAKPRVYIETFGSYQTSPKGYKIDEIITMAGGINIAHDLYPPPGVSVDPEWVVEQNPDIIIKEASRNCGFGVDDPKKIKAIRNEIMNRPELANVNAVKNEKVYVASSDIVRSGLQGFVWAGYCAKWFHPDLFEDLDPESIQQGYVDRFLRIDYDLNEHGVFVYPPIEIDGGLAGIPDRYKGQI